MVLASLQEIVSIGQTNWHETWFWHITETIGHKTLKDFKRDLLGLKNMFTDAMAQNKKENYTAGQQLDAETY